MNPLQPTLDALDEGLRVFGKYFDPPIYSDPALLLVPAGRRNMLGWTGPNCWRDTHLEHCSGCAEKGEGTHQEGTVEHPAKRTEIVICSEFLAEGIECLGTLLHEMVHYANHERGLKDCSARQYHNRKFKGLAERVGLEVHKTSGKGWAATSWKKDGPTYIEAEALLLRHPLAFKYQYAASKGLAKPKPYWRCACGNGGNVIATRSFDATCGNCGKAYQRLLGGSDAI